MRKVLILLFSFYSCLGISQNNKNIQDQAIQSILEYVKTFKDEHSYNSLSYAGGVSLKVADNKICTIDRKISTPYTGPLLLGLHKDFTIEADLVGNAEEKLKKKGLGPFIPWLDNKLIHEWHLDLIDQLDFDILTYFAPSTIID